MRRLALLTALAVSAALAPAGAQELNCNVDLNRAAITGTEHVIDGGTVPTA